MVEIWFSILTKQQIRRDVYHDVAELIAAIEHFRRRYHDTYRRPCRRSADITLSAGV